MCRASHKATDSDDDAMLEVCSEEYEDAVEMSPGYVAVGGDWGSIWGSLAATVSIIYANKDMIDVGCNALDAVRGAGLGSALKTGMQLVDAAAAGNSAALNQIRNIANAAKAGDTSKRPAHDMLRVINSVAKGAVSAAVGHRRGGRRGGFPGGVMWPTYNYADPWLLEEAIAARSGPEEIELTMKEADAIAERVAAKLAQKGK